MVVNEITSSVQAKGTKTVVAAAVTTLMAGAATAGLPEGAIKNDNLPTNLVTNDETTKLVSGQGNEISIQTNGSVSELWSNLKKINTDGEMSETLAALLQALGPTDTSTVITGVTGGWNLMDAGTAHTINIAGLKLPEEMAKKLLGQFNYNTEEANLFTPPTGGYFGKEGNIFEQTGDTHIQIGGEEGANPLVLGVVGGDFVLSTNGYATKVTHNGTANIEIASGNVAGVVGGSVAVVSSRGSDASKKGAVEVSIKNTQLSIVDTANVGGFVAGGVAVGAAGADVTSSVTGSTNVTIDTNPESGALNGLVIGGLGGGLAVAVGGSNAAVNNGQTTLVDVKNGEVLGLIGGGAAVSGDITLEGSGLVTQSLQAIIGKGSGTATSTSGDILINLSDKSATAAVMGGGVAVADADEKNKGSSTSTAKSVTMNLEGAAALTEADKSKLHNAAYKFLPKVVESIKNKELKFSISDFSEFAAGVNVDGAHVGNLGGGVAVANSDGDSVETAGSAVAESSVEKVVMNLNGGYNVATALGGLAIAHDSQGYARKESGKTQATAKVTEAYLNINGGENVLVTAGGLSYATASNGIDSMVKAEAEIGKAVVTMTGGTVDGLFGGGIAIDDTNADDTNASTVSKSIEITAKGGTINVANVDPITGIAHGNPSGAPSNGSYAYQTAKLIGDEMGNVAILGAGMATGGGALAQAETVQIYLEGGEVKGNIFAGGAATLGGKAEVTGSALVQVNGAKVTGDIYGGGLSGSPDNEAFDASYKSPTSTVKATTIALLKGELEGNVYLGGKAFSESAKVGVESGELVLAKDFVFKGETIDGSGADKATLTIVDGYDFQPVEAETPQTRAAAAQSVIISGFDNLNSAGTVTGASYDFGDKKNTTVNGIFDFESITKGSGEENVVKTMTIESGAVAVKGTYDNAFAVEQGVLALGSDATTTAAIDAMSLYPGDAALYLSGTVDLKEKHITIGKTEAADGVTIGSNGMLIVDAAVKGAEEEGQKATTVEGTVNGEDGSALHFVNVADQGLVKVETTIDQKNWTVDNVLFEITKGENDTYSFDVVTDAGKLDGLGLGGFDGSALGEISKQKDAASEAIKDLLDQTNGAVTSGDKRHAQINAALNLAAAGGVQTAGIETAMMGVDKATKRASLTNVFNDGWTGFAEVTGTQLKLGGDRGSLETKTELGGVAVGGEYTAGDMTFGVVGNFGTGDVTGEGDNGGVKNDVDYYGIQAYAAKRFGQFNVVGQMGYVMTDNDIKHDFGDEVKVDADVFTIGARGEMAWALNDKWTAVPYVGVNYLRVATDGYTTKTGFKVGDVDQNLVNLPIGVAVSGDCSVHGGWTVRPTVDVAYVHTFGDTDLDATTGVGATNIGTTLDVWSENVGRLNVGVEARKDNMAFGFNFGGAVGDMDHSEVYGQLNVKYVF